MKIILAYEHIRRLTGTHGEWITSIGRRLAQRGHDVHILCDSVADTSLYPELSFHSRRTFVRGESHRLAALHLWSRRQLRKITHDISISFHTAIPAQIIIPIQGWVQTRLKREHRLHHNSIWTTCLHAYPPVMERKYIESLIRKNHNTTGIFAATSTVMRDALVERYPILRQRMRLILGASSIEPPYQINELNSMRREARRLLGINDNDIVFLWGSKHAGWHGADFLINAFAKMVASADKQNHARLIMACENQYSLHHRARKAGIADRVRILGRTDHFHQLLAACDIGVNPAVFSHLGRFTWECLAFAKPVIASTDTPGIDRMRRPDQGLAGRIVQPYDITTLRNALEDMMDESCRTNATRLARDIAPTMRFDDFITRIETLADNYRNNLNPNTPAHTTKPPEPVQSPSPINNTSGPVPCRSISASSESISKEQTSSEPLPNDNELLTATITPQPNQGVPPGE